MMQTTKFYPISLEQAFLSLSKLDMFTHQVYFPQHPFISANKPHSHTRSVELQDGFQEGFQNGFQEGFYLARKNAKVYKNAKEIVWSELPEQGLFGACTYESGLDMHGLDSKNETASEGFCFFAPEVSIVKSSSGSSFGELSSELISSDLSNTEFSSRDLSFLADSKDSFSVPTFSLSPSSPNESPVYGIEVRIFDSFIDKFSNNLQVNSSAFQTLPLTFELFDDWFEKQGEYSSATNIQIRKEFPPQWAHYKNAANTLLDAIQAGNIYEVNYCIPHLLEAKIEDPAALFSRIHSEMLMPFSAFLKFDQTYILSFSPERFIAKQGENIISQPIKGTRKRETDLVLDRKVAQELQNSEKERAENVMIVDLVRNDMSRIAETGSVTVPELCQLYSFPTVHQLISTVSAKVNRDVSFFDIWKALFPMGSMTGAPKINAMKYIQKTESMPRHWFSGSVGCISSEGNFDFNVLIRTLVYEASQEQIQVWAGSALTSDADIALEFEECIIKIERIWKILKELNTKQ